MPSDAPADRVEAIIADVLQVSSDDIDPDTHLEADLAAESLDYAEIAETIEFDLGVAVPDEALDGMETVGDVTEYVGERT